MYSRTAKPSPLGALGLAALLSLLPAVAIASPLQGEWRGLVQQANSDVAVIVRFSGQAATIHFNEPFACDVPAKFMKDDGAASVYRFAPSPRGGHFCDGLFGQNLTVTPGTKGHLSIVFVGGRATWRGELSQSPAAAR